MRHIVSLALVRMNLSKVPVGISTDYATLVLDL